jgi:glycosyltransferase involved in cell wall biosynthesis
MPEACSGPQFVSSFYTSPMQSVSVIMTVLNEARDIERGVASLLALEPPAAEIVVVDGGSDDGTWAKLAAMQARNSQLVAVRDETCNLKHCAGPISRGRNVAIAAAKCDIIACADAGCSYAPDWLRNLTGKIVAGEAEYALGGSCLDPAEHTVWDVASVPFLGVKLAANEPQKSCTARSMAFTKELWQRIGGFPEDVLLGEDTLFDFAARGQTQPDFANYAKALYRPENSFAQACGQLARYAFSDGQARVRGARLFRNAARCMLQVLAVIALPWSVIPLLFVLALELVFAFKKDGRSLVRFGTMAVLARLVFSLAVPWVVAVNQMRGIATARSHRKA